MSSSDDEPLARRTNGSISDETIPKALDKAMEQKNGHTAPPGISIRNGPVTDDAMDLDDEPIAPGKRKSRGSIAKAVNYNEVPSASEDEKPMKRQRTTSKKTAPVDSDSDAPISRRRSTGKLPISIKDTGDSAEVLAEEKKHIEKVAEKEAKAIRAKEAKSKKAPAAKDESDDEPIARSRGKKNGVKKEESSDDDIPLAKKGKAAVKKPTAKGKAKAEPKTKAAPKVKPEHKAKGKAAKKEVAKKESSEDAEQEEEEEEEYRWWEESKEDDSIKWTTLQHNGVVFPPDYKPLPANVKLLYDGKPVSMDPEAEEVAGFFGAMLHSKLNVENPVFQKNFFRDFKEILDRTGGATDKDGNQVLIKEFSKMDFHQIFEYYQAENAAKKARPAAERKAEKAENDAMTAPYQYCLWDGRKEKVGNFRVEPPSLFRGRGDHPKTGSVKKRVMPEQVTINIGKEATVPAPPAGHKWKEVKHDNKATWLAMWQENINNNYKYVMLAANSAVKGQSDFKKFEKARELKKHIDRIRKDYQKDLKSELMADRQRATAVYLIDKFALRAGNEKDSENEAETVGCCSMKFEHITLRPPNTVIFDFLGKDSIRFYDEVTVDAQVFKNLKIFKKHPKKEGDDIFDRLNTSQLNKHLAGYMPGLTAKVFRTYNASFTMSNLLKELKVSKATIPEKIKLYNDCNRQVAILCNHKRTVTAGHAGAMEKLSDKIKAVKYQKWRIKQMILALDPAEKKKLIKKEGADFFDLDEELDQTWIEEHQEALVEEMRSKIEKKFQKDNEKLVAEGEKEMEDSELQERLKKADDAAKMYKKENKTGKVEPEGASPSVDKYLNQIEKLDARINTMNMQAEDREGNKEVALGTSKINYIDPRLTVVFANKFDVPLEKLFSKTLREKFNWAIQSVKDDADWEF